MKLFLSEDRQPSKLYKGFYTLERSAGTVKVDDLRHIARKHIKDLTKKIDKMLLSNESPQLITYYQGQREVYRHFFNLEEE